MSKKAKVPKDGKPDLGQETMKKLANLENDLLQGTPAEAEQASLEIEQQTLEMLSTLESDLLQADSPSRSDGEPVDEAALWDSLAELEVDLLYDEPVAEDVVETAVSAPTPTVVEEEVPLVDELVALEDEVLDAADDAFETVEQFEDEVLYEPETAVDIEDEALLEAEQELLESEPLEVLADANLEEDLALIAEDEADDLEESIVAVVENAFTTPLDPILVEEEADDDLAAEIEGDEWDDLADIEADLLATTDGVSDLSDVTESEALDALATLESSFLFEADGDEAETAVVEADDDAFVLELEGEDSQILDELIATIDDDLTSGTAVETIIDLSPAQTSNTYTWEQHVIFTLAGNKYAVPATNIREVGDINYITPVPNVPEWLLGITNLRGDILSLVHLGIFLGVNKNGSDHLQGVTDVEMMVVQSEQEATAITTGIIVDEVSDIRDLAMERVRIPTAPINSQLGAYMRGVYEENSQMYILLDLERLLMSPEMWQFEAV